MKITTINQKRVICYILQQLYKRDSIPLDEILGITRGELRRNVNQLIRYVLEENQIVKIENDTIKKGKIYYSAVDHFYLQRSIDVNVSNKGDRGYKASVEIIPLKPIDKIVKTMKKFHVKNHSTYVRCSKVRIYDPLGTSNVNAECQKTQSENTVTVTVSFDPHALPGQIIKFSYYTYDIEYYGITIDELKQKYNVDYSSEGFAILAPTHYARITVRLPWKPSYVGAFETITTPSGVVHIPTDLSPDQKNENIIKLELYNPPMRGYSLLWKPP